MAVRLKISGRVQGVWFRASTQVEARKMGIRGWVRNLPDGSVEVVATGDQLPEFIRWCHQGPPLARVLSVEQSPAPEEPWLDFELRR